MTLNGVTALFCVISANSGSIRAHCVKVHVRYLISWWVLVLAVTAGVFPPRLAADQTSNKQNILRRSSWPLTTLSLRVCRPSRLCRYIAAVEFSLKSVQTVLNIFVHVLFSVRRWLNIMTFRPVLEMTIVRLAIARHRWSLMQLQCCTSAILLLTARTDSCSVLAPSGVWK